MKSAIVTGATGFIGSEVVRQLIESGVSVLALGRKNLADVHPFRRKKLEGAHYISIDMFEIEQLPALLRNGPWTCNSPCVFYHFAWGGEARLSDWNAEAQFCNIPWSVEALHAAGAIGCSKFIYVGTMEEVFTRHYLYLDHRTEEKFNRHLVYAYAKTVGRNFLKLLHHEAGVPAIFATNSHVMGPGDDKDSFLQETLRKMIVGEELVFSSGEQLFDVIDVRDCAKAYCLIGDRGRRYASYWVGSGSPKPLRQYVEDMAKQFPGHREMQFGKYRFNDVTLSPSDFSTQALVDHTGFQPAFSYEETVDELARWLRLQLRGSHAEPELR